MWKLEDSSLEPERLLLNESLFSLANGYLGVRGCFEEGYDQAHPTVRGTYINGFYETVAVKYDEKLYAFPEKKEKLPNVIDAQGTKIYLDQEEVSLFKDQHQSFNRILHLDKGISERQFEYTTNHGKKALISIKRLVSLVHKELFLIHVKVDYQGKVEIISSIQGDVRNFTDDFDPRVSGEHAHLVHFDSQDIQDDVLQMTVGTRESNLRLTCTAKHKAYGNELSIYNESLGDAYLQTCVESNGPMEVTKFVVYTDSRHYDDVETRGMTYIQRWTENAFDDYARLQKDYLEAFWRKSDIVIDGVAKIQQGVRYNLYQLLQSVGKDGMTNIAAKGLSGEGYEGHYFWDTEIYVLPVLLMTQPEIAEKLLTYRYHTLDEARARARDLGHKKGVKFPWRTITGGECSTFFPAGTAQYHINGDVAYSFIQDYLYRKNLKFMCDYGAEVLFETARTWLEIGHFYKGQFMIHDVTGPDEYTCIVDNNYYTNLLAKYNLKWAVLIYDKLQEKYPNKFQKLLRKIDMQQDERDAMEEASNAMYLPYDEVLGIHKQDDSFLQKKVWDFANTPKENYPLLLHYHPLTIYRYQVIKQADTVLAHFLLEDYVEDDVIKRSYDYYETITTHDSSLSSCIYGIMASKCGYLEKAYDYFEESVRLDLDNTHGNTKDGLHIANLAGTVMSVIFGFGGYRIKENGISIWPWCPATWNTYTFKIQYHERLIQVKVMSTIEIELIEGKPLEITVYDEVYTLSDRLSVPLKEDNSID